MTKTKTLTFNEDQLRVTKYHLVLSKSASLSYEDYIKINEIIDLLETAPYNEDSNL